METKSFKPQLIGFSGKLNSGKDYSARILMSLFCKRYFQTATKHINPLEHAEKYTEGELAKATNFEVKHFADNLKQMCSTMSGAPLDWFYNRDKKDWKLDPPFNQYTVRTLMTEMGKVTDGVAKGWMASTLLADYKPNTPTTVLIPDARFENEVKAIEDHGGIVIRINRGLKYRHPGYEALEDVAKQDSELYQRLMNKSETALDNHEFQYEIVWQDDPWEIVEDLQLIFNIHFGIEL